MTSDGVVPIRAVGIVLPVHNEEALLADALEALEANVVHLANRGVTCRSVIVLDRCDDHSPTIAQRWLHNLRRRQKELGGSVVRSQRAGVGSARRTGCTVLLNKWATIDSQTIWLATTDADSRVPPEWLDTQLRARQAGADLWVGRVSVEDWSHFDDHTATRWRQEYAGEAHPIHGASMGFNARAYEDAGGFPRLCTGEDRALHESIVEIGGRVHYAEGAKVVTSGRRHARAPLGFAHALSLAGSPSNLAVGLA